MHLVALFFGVCFAANVVPITPPFVGRHTIYTTGIDSGNCGFGAMSGPFLPAGTLGFAMSDLAVPLLGKTPTEIGGWSYGTSTNGVGVVNGNKCGVCYQVTRIVNQAFVVMVTNHCPDCSTSQPHLDMHPDTAAKVDGGLTQQQGAGFTAVSLREVSCGFSSNVLYQWSSLSAPFNYILNFARHNVQLNSTIWISENGAAAYPVVRGTHSDGTWPWRPQGPNGNANFPIQITLSDLFGNTRSFSLTSMTANTMGDTGFQFPDPPANYAGATSVCTQCTQPYLNNGQAIFFKNSQFPQQTGQWIPLTQNAWAAYSTTLTPSTKVLFPGGSAQSGSINLAQWGEVHFGCNVKSPKSMATAFTFAAILDPNGPPSATLQIWSSSGTHETLTPPVNNTNWNVYSWNIANNAAITGTSFNDIQIQTNTAATFYFDNMGFVFPPNSDLCQPFLALNGTGVATNAPGQNAEILGAKNALILLIIMIALFLIM